jgi:hypothetical protein
MDKELQLKAYQILSLIKLRAIILGSPWLLEVPNKELILLFFYD